MTEHTLVDSAPAKIENTKMTDRGLVVTALAARTGIQDYLASDLGLVGDHVVKVYRPESAVFQRDSIEGYAGAPVTIDHPSEPVTPDNWCDLAKGHVGQDIVREGDHVRVTFTVNDASAIAAIQGGKREISMGYTTPISVGDGVTEDGQAYGATQTGPIQINHLAIVDRARGGSKLRIGDGAEGKRGSAPNTNRAEEPNMADNLKTMTVDGISISVTDQASQVITKLQDSVTSLTDKVTDLEKDLVDAKKEVETKDGELTAVKKDLADKTSPAALQDMAKKRVDVMKAGKKSGMSEEDMEKMEDGAIKRAVVAKSLGDAEAKEMTDDQIEGAFRHAAKAEATRTDDALGKGIQTADGDDPWAFLDKKEA